VTNVKEKSSNMKKWEGDIFCAVIRKEFWKITPFMKAASSNAHAEI